MLLYLDIRLGIISHTYLVVPLFILHLNNDDLLYWDIWLVRDLILRLMPVELLFFVTRAIVSIFLRRAFYSVVVLWNVGVFVGRWQVWQLVVESICDYIWRICEVVLEEQIRLLGRRVIFIGRLENLRIDAVWCFLASKYSLLISSRLLLLLREARLFIKHVYLGCVRLHVKVFNRVAYSPILLLTLAWPSLHWSDCWVLDLLLRLSMLHGRQL